MKRASLEVIDGGVECQLRAFPSELPTGAPSLHEPWLRYLRRRLRGFWYRVRRELRPRRAGAPPGATMPRALPSPELQVGDRVRVRSAEYVRSTLDENGALHGCGFGLGMYQYCGRELRVAKKIENFYDEARGRMLRARHLVALEGVHCDGSSSRETRGCDRMCFYFWRTEWLEKP